MTRHTLIKAIWVLLVALFLSVQSLSQAHAAANDGLDHTHDGVACSVALVAAEQVTLEPPLPVLMPLQTTEPRLWAVLIEQDLPRNFDGRAPPPRGPPAL